ncbi:redoxin family protein [bacterium]|nr:redoxin family protein [bacterium]
MNQKIRAPELSPNLGWLNTDRPLRFSHELRGRVVLLDFWTYCCINCMHVLPVLAWLEEKYRDEPFQVIGVHSAKFDNEAGRETIRAAIARYEIKHPVVIDDGMGIWQAYAVRGWPTLVLVDAEGYLVGAESGEGLREVFERAIDATLERGRRRDVLAEGPLELKLDADLLGPSELAFPGKLLADASGQRLFIADSNHNRIVVATLPDASGRARLLDLIGAGRQGSADGSFDDVQFHHPQGLALDGDALFVADTENHLIRQVDLERKTVRTIAGTGRQVHDRRGGNVGRQQGLNSPWDLALDGRTLYIAMAGPHQLWRMNLATGMVEAFAGSGREDILDGTIGAAALAQPSGLALAPGRLYFADSETSSIRFVDLDRAFVQTLVGRGLFVFGDVDGRGDAARLQHPLGVAWHDGALLVADTYNHKIKRLDPDTREVRTLFGLGRPATRGEKGQLGLFEPGGLSVAEGRLYVADTNNHRVVMVDMKTGAWAEVMIEGLTPPMHKRRSLPARKISATIPATGALRLLLSADLPPGTHPAADAPMFIRVASGERVIAQETRKTDALPVALELAPADLDGTDALEVTWALAYCKDGPDAQCIPAQWSWLVTLTRAENASPELRLSGRP